MNNIENIGIEVLEIFTEKQNFDNKYSDMMISFLTKAYELVELSKDLYQIEHTIRLNKISLKDYILNSDICILLKENDISNYSIEELKDYMNKFESQNISSDIYPYKLALELYEKLEKIEEVENEKVNYEINRLSKLLNNLSNIKNIDKDKYQNLYNKLILEVKEQYLDNNYIDDKVNDYIVQMLNDIFNYYLYGNKEIPMDTNIN